MFSCFESSRWLGKHIRVQTFFMIPDEGAPFRRSVYQYCEDGSVVAYQDIGGTTNTDLHAELMFYELYKDEDPWQQIQADSGVYALPHIKFFSMR